ncbi:MAG: protein tyrosine phosphatase family protein [Melioribacteraceae bacterium]|nr:protein tyrosine phosphatase family protein [Melioribacteraceae bacterium]
MNSLNSIFKFHKINNFISIAGQPGKTEFKTVAANKFDLVINIRTDEEMDSLFDEKNIVESLGMKYFQINMSLDNPREDSFHRFYELLTQHNGKKIFIHCKANKRVSAFTAAYLIIKNKISEPDGFNLIYNIWEPTDNWLKFIEDRIKQYKQL